jgi:hypothetical protein
MLQDDKMFRVKTALFVPEYPAIVPIILIVFVPTFASRLVDTKIEGGLAVNVINEASIAAPFYNIV